MLRHVIPLLISALCAGAAWSSPSVLVYHEQGEGYGDAVLEAIEELWPQCSPSVFTGYYEQAGFNAALASGQWDLILLECWIATTDGLDWHEVKKRYLFDESEVFVYNWYFWGSSGEQFLLYMAMGVEDLAPSCYNFMIEVWDPGHPLVQGITDWEQYGIFPEGGSSIIRHLDLVYGDDTHAVAGWEQIWGGGICVAGDGESVVSGFCPAYAYQGVAIWKNILEFMWDGDPLQQTTWAQIKGALQ